MVAELLSLTDGTLTGDTVAARGPIAATSGFDGGDGTLRIDGGGDQLVTGTATVSAGELPNVVIDKPGGTLSLSGTIRVASGGWTYLAGALDPGTSTVSFDSGSLIAGSHALANVVLRGSGAKTLPAGETLTVGGLLTLTDGTWDGGTLLAAGDIAQASGFDGGSGLLLIGGSGNQLFTGSASSTTGQLPAVVIDKPGGTLSLAGTIRTLHDWTYLAGALNAGGSTLVLSGTQTLATEGASLNRLQVRSATAMLSGSLVLAGDLVITSGSFDLDANAVDVAGTVTVGGTLDATGADLQVAGNLLVTGLLVADGSVITLDGGVLQHLDTDGATLGDLVIDGTVGTTLDDDVAVSGTLDLVSGTLTLGTRRLTIEHPIAGTPTNLVAGATSSLTIAGSTPGIEVPASVTDLAELSIQTVEAVSLDGPLALHVRLRLDGGNLDADGHLVRILAGATVARTSGHVIGTLEKPISAGGPLTVTFEIGDASGYTPLVATWGAVSLDGTLAATTAAGDDAAGLAAVGLVPTASVNRTWTLAPAGLANDPIEVGVTYLPGDLDPLADPAFAAGSGLGRRIVVTASGRPALGERPHREPARRAERHAGARHARVGCRRGHRRARLRRHRHALHVAGDRVEPWCLHRVGGRRDRAGCWDHRAERRAEPGLVRGDPGIGELRHRIGRPRLVGDDRSRRELLLHGRPSADRHSVRDRRHRRSRLREMTSPPSTWSHLGRPSPSPPPSPVRAPRPCRHLMASSQTRLGRRSPSPGFWGWGCCSLRQSRSSPLCAIVVGRSAGYDPRVTAPRARR